LTEGWLKASLGEKIPEQVSRSGLEPVRRFLAGKSGDLHVEWEFSTRRGWLEVKVRGEDAEAFLNLLKETLGIVPVDGSRVEKWDIVKGSLVGAGGVGFGVYVDLGVLEPVAKDGLYPLHRMRAQLADGVPKSCREILGEYGMVDYFPVKARVTAIEGEKISLELADQTYGLLQSWRRLPFDRVVATGVLREEAEGAVRMARLQFDVIRVEPLSLFSQCLVCKMGTDAPGVIAKVGTRLKGVGLAAYRARAR